jgi:hypothetical protein
MFELTEEALQKIGTLFVNMMKKKIKERIYPFAPGYSGDGKISPKSPGDKYASGNLYNSLTATVMPNGDDFELVITYADYFKYVNQGRKANVKKVPLTALLDWIKIRGIRGVKRGKGRGAGRISNLSLAFAIRENIYKYGIRPADIYDKGLDSLEEIFENPPPEMREAYNELYAAIERDVVNFVDANLVTKEIETIKFD